MARNVDGIVEMMLDATQNCFKALSAERLFDWYAALFPTGRSGLYKITVANWRTDSAGPMQVVSGAIGREKVHFQAPHSSVLESEMKQFLNWFNTDTQLDLVLKAAVAHLWFVTVHPFEDGNGRIAESSDRHAVSAIGQKFSEILQHVRSNQGRKKTVLRNT